VGDGVGVGEGVGVGVGLGVGVIVGFGVTVGVGVGVGFLAFTCIFVNALSNKKIRNAITMICIFFILFFPRALLKKHFIVIEVEIERKLLNKQVF